MIVANKGYLTLEDVLRLNTSFSIYETSKKTQILIKNTNQDEVYLHFPKRDRLPWKTVEGKNICHGTKVFDSSVDKLTELSTTKWNNGNQILCYEEFCLFT